MNKLLILLHHAESTYWFRRELIARFCDEGYEVHLSVPDHETVKNRLHPHVICHETKLNRHGLNPVSDWKLFQHYCKMIREIRPDVIFSYTIKPNIYGSFAARQCHVPIICNITGLGSVFQRQGSILYRFVTIMYKSAFRHVDKVFFQNREGNDRFLALGLVSHAKSEVIPGSGVNIQWFKPDGDTPLKKKPGEIVFLLIARVMKAKGIDEYIAAAKVIRAKYPDTKFQIVGMMEEERYIPILKELEEKGIIEYLGEIQDIRDVMKWADCIVLPSYYPEGMSNVLLEGAAMEKPVITCDISGCREAVEDGVTGMICKPQNAENLIQAFDRFIQMPINERIRMGKKGREKIVREFDRDIVIQKYMDEVQRMLKKRRSTH